jgi:uncharacterized Tic20 family protein
MGLPMLSEMDTNMEEIDEELDEQVAAEPARGTETDKDARNWAIVCHLSAFLVFLRIPFGNILGPLTIWLIKRNDYAFVNDQGKAALNFQISMTLYAIIIAVFGFGILHTTRRIWCQYRSHYD